MTGLIIFLILFGIPIAEIALFIEVGDRIGLWATLGAILLTALIGTVLVRAQGMAVLSRIRQETEQGRLPVGDLLSGACLVIAGLLLVTPGFLTDFIGFALLIPGLRLLLGTALVRALIRKGGTVHFQAADFRSGGPGAGPGGMRRRNPEGTIDGDYTVIDPGDGTAGDGSAGDGTSRDGTSVDGPDDDGPDDDGPDDDIRRLEEKQDGPEGETPRR